jgi:hypothetical protein
MTANVSGYLFSPTPTTTTTAIAIVAKIQGIYCGI